jgi:MFS transporter, DHA1 family, inner membrane transport protein
VKVCEGRHQRASAFAITKGVTTAELVRARPRLRPRSGSPSPQRPRPLLLASLALALGGFAIGTTEFVAMGLLPEIAHGVGISVPTAGHVISAYALGVVVGAPVLAALGAKLPRRRLLVGLMVFYALGNLLSAVAANYPMLLVARFVTGLPHGAYFGVASLVAADLAPEGKKAQAVSRVLLGLGVANVAGVPLATWVGQTFGWRAALVMAAALAGATALSVLRVVPNTPADAAATMRRELTALKRPQVLLAVATGAIGGGGLFAIYSYISPIMTDRAGLSLHAVPFVLAVWGLGMVAGNVVGGKLMDRAPKRSMVGSLIVMAALFGLFAVTSATPVLAIISVFTLGGSMVLPMGLQMRLMATAGDAQTLAAALNHASFNLANALGAWLGGIVLAAGLGLTAPMLVAVGLSLAGLVILALSLWLERSQRLPLA